MGAEAALAVPGSKSCDSCDAAVIGSLGAGFPITCGASLANGLPCCAACTAASSSSESVSRYQSSSALTKRTGMWHIGLSLVRVRDGLAATCVAGSEPKAGSVNSGPPKGALLSLATLYTPDMPMKPAMRGRSPCSLSHCGWLATNAAKCAPALCPQSHTRSLFPPYLCTFLKVQATAADTSDTCIG